MRPTLVAALASIAACRGPRAPHPGSATSVTIELGQPGLRGVAADATSIYSSRSTNGKTIVEARRDRAIRWTADLAGASGPIAIAGDLVIVPLGGNGTLAFPKPLELRGEPGAVVVALDATTGAVRWRLAFDATAWCVITSVATGPLGTIVGGTFSGTLRAGEPGRPGTIVSSAGDSDGFVARVDAAGTAAWVVRFGGGGADAIQGVAQRADRVAIAGTFTAGADLLGAPLPPFDERSPYGDGFVAELDAAGARRWAQTFGGKADEGVAGVAIDAHGRVAVAATVRGAVRVGETELAAHGASNGLVVWVSPGGELGTATIIGGADPAGLRAITAVDDRAVIGGVFSGSITLGDHALTATGDDAFLATIDAEGSIGTAWHIGGAGREEIAALGTVPGGIVAGITHSAGATIGDETLPVPTDRANGSAIVIRAAP